VNGLEAPAALPADTHEDDDDLGAADGRAHLVVVAEVGTVRLLLA
jgi:hypothetical protein